MTPRSAEDIVRLGQNPYADLRELLLYVEVDEPASDPFRPAIRTRHLHAGLLDDVVATGFGGIETDLIRAERNQRRRVFDRERARDPRRPVVLCEGDSWNQHPLLTDIVDWIAKAGYLPDCLSEAGDLLSRMTEAGAELEEALSRVDDSYVAFVFSGGGNDILGTEIGPDGRKTSVLRRLLAPPSPGMKAVDFVRTGEVDRALATVRARFETLIRLVRSRAPALPIVLHGYDHAIPSGAFLDLRFLFRGRWLADPMREHGIESHRLQREIVAALVNRFYEEVLLPLAGSSVAVADLRGTNTNVGGWADEIHPSSWGFQPVAEKIMGHIPAIAPTAVV
ncbi:hypothetical protein [Salinarimonas sp.]|uniref:hypothetical protein n=1 Tax=Salinarimonas sp. TaxID=2766526 RepID=UPI0032D990E7